MSIEPSSSRPAPEGMPSLLGSGRRNNSSGERSDAQDTRILWALASDADLPTPARKHRSHRSRWMLAALLLATAGAGLLLWLHATQDAEGQLAAAARITTSTQEAVSPKTEPAAAASAVAVASRDMVASEPAGAVLIDAPPAAAASAPAVAAAVSPLAALAANDVIPAASAATRKSTTPAVPAPRRDTTKEKATAIASATNTKPASSTGSRASADADVALIEAMVAHISNGQRSTNGTSAGAAGSPTRTGSRLSTHEQLKRCKSQSGADASACRAKACSGRWGADPECPTLPRATALK